MDKRCSTCVYRAPGRNDLDYSCDYISITGHSRGCPPGKDCTMYQRGKRLIPKCQITVKKTKKSEYEYKQYLQEITRKKEG